MTSRFQSKIQCVALIGKYQSRQIEEALLSLAKYFHQLQIKVVFERESTNFTKSDASCPWQILAMDQLAQIADVAIVVGGDGTMLRAARELANYNIPLVGINRGHLGFLTDIAREQMLEAMGELLAGNFTQEQRMLISAEICNQDGEIIYNGLALNDIVIVKGCNGRLIELSLFIDQHFIYNLRADGLIIATPTGSTAYSLAAGGPIIVPQITSMAIVPLCAHSLTNRPLIIDGNSNVVVKIANGEESCLHFDGQNTQTLNSEYQVKINKFAKSICFLHPPEHSYFAMLREKLNWSEDLRLSSTSVSSK